MNIKIGNKVIVEPIYSILKTVQRELTNGKLKDIDNRKDGNILITCPCHKDGHENHPSCNVATSTETDLEPGFAHCFTCGYNAPLVQVIGDCFDQDADFGTEWLLERFGNVIVDYKEYLPEIKLNPEPEIVTQKEYLDESVLLQYDFYHPYMWKRKLSKEVVDRFRVGYDRVHDAITFPVYDEHHKLVMVTARSVTTKRFYIPEGVEKPVYLLYDILKRNVRNVFVCESQLNALTLRTWGYDSVALFGTGSDTQYETLKKSNISSYVLVFDGDEAGIIGAKRFRKNMPKDVFITEVRMLAGKDVNDLDKEQFEKLLRNS